MVFKAILIFGIMLVFPQLLGYMLSLFTKCKEHTKLSNLMFQYITGHLVMWALFEIIAVPSILIKINFMILVYIWSGIITICICGTLIYIYRTKQFKQNSFDFRIQSINKFSLLLLIILIALILYQCYYYIFYMHLDADDSRFIVNAVEAYNNNSMLRINPMTGEVVNTWIGELSKDVVSPWMLYIALLSKICNISPTIFAHTILPSFLIVIAYESYWLLAKRLFRNENIESSYIFCIIICLLNIFFNASVYTESTFLLTRVWQGKAVVAGVLIPFLFYNLYSLHQHSSGIGKYIVLILTNISLCLMSGIGIIASIVITCLYGGWYMILKRNWYKFMCIFLTCIPSLVYAFIYFIIK